jgi:hypothetical protein
MINEAEPPLPADYFYQWVVYDHPKDFPDGFIARLWTVGRGGRIEATNSIITTEDVGEIRKYLIAQGYIRMPRHPNDDPCILEVWL